MSRVSIFALLAAVAVSVIVANAGFVEVSLDRLEGGDIGTLFLTVIFTALVIERAVEVYINNSFDPTEKKLSRDIDIAKRKVEIAEEALTEETKRQAQPGVQPDPGELTRLRDEVAAARRELLEEKKRALEGLTIHKNNKSAWASAVATILSLAAAAAGVRVLGQFLPVDQNGMLTGPLARDCLAVATELTKDVANLDDAVKKACKAVEFQLTCFRAADVLLTSFLLAGGADGIHQLVKRFTNPDNAAPST